MDVSGRELADRFGKLMADGDTGSLALMYAPEARVVLFYGSASGRSEIRELLDKSLTTHGSYNVISIDQFQQVEDVIMWDSTVETETGPLQTTHVVVLDDDGLIRRHIPGIRGYWGM